jgi:hypothetical protein
MTTLRRDIVSVPRRTPAETWERISELVSKDGSDAREELHAASHVATALIAQEATKLAPAIFTGAGPQVRIYTLHDDDSLEADLDDEQALVTPVADGDWTATLPADVSDVAWARAALKKVSTRVTVREVSS